MIRIVFSLFILISLQGCVATIALSAFSGVLGEYVVSNLTATKITIDHNISDSLKISKAALSKLDVSIDMVEFTGSGYAYFIKGQSFKGTIFLDRKTKRMTRVSISATGESLLLRDESMENAIANKILKEKKVRSRSIFFGWKNIYETKALKHKIAKYRGGADLTLFKQEGGKYKIKLPSGKFGFIGGVIGTFKTG